MAVPSALSLSWGADSFASMMQFFGVRAKLRLIDGIDIDAINKKDLELREQLYNMPVNLDDLFNPKPAAPVQDIQVNAIATDTILATEV